MDIISMLCWIVLICCGFSALILGYVLYLDWLWGIHHRKMLAKGIKWPIEPISDVEYTEVARYD